MVRHGYGTGDPSLTNERHPALGRPSGHEYSVGLAMVLVRHCWALSTRIWPVHRPLVRPPLAVFMSWLATGPVTTQAGSGIGQAASSQVVAWAIAVRLRLWPFAASVAVLNSCPQSGVR